MRHTLLSSSVPASMALASRPTYPNAHLFSAVSVPLKEQDMIGPDPDAGEAAAGPLMLPAMPTSLPAERLGDITIGSTAHLAFPCSFHPAAQAALGVPGAAAWLPSSRPYGSSRFYGPPTSSAYGSFYFTPQPVRYSASRSVAAGSRLPPLDADEIARRLRKEAPEVRREQPWNHLR